VCSSDLAFTALLGHRFARAADFAGTGALQVDAGWAMESAVSHV